MKKYIIVFSLSLLTLTVAAQKRRKKQVPPPKEFIPVVKPDYITNGSAADALSVPMPTTSSVPILYTIAPVPIHATTIEGKEMRFKNIEELTTTDLSKLKELSFRSVGSGKSIDSGILQQIIERATQLEILGIDNFELAVFPEIKTAHHHLKKLALRKNKLTSLPASISNLTALTAFDCDNPLAELPPSFTQLKNLEELGLYNHLFTAFPAEIFSLSQLSILYLSGNYKSETKLKELPDLFQQLPELKELGIQNAELSSLPRSIATLKKLDHANFSNNQFKSFPEVLATNPKLVYVPFDDNPLQWEPFLASIKKIQWRGLFFLYETGFTKKQYEQLQKILSKIDVYYDGMND
ncbi:leucine-rich repeat domain-containing protein [Sphingobacterium athyrii]|uniref:Leucine-rich repeat domain-containing protein n=1 Tax=Sphingobacterium athyrii TaxID=2152717 RepID=A0A363NP52_9SPHI|nr:hypothetical protein [Sphingobacterium athyrii]PUV22572.1 hypothetical protein DCO56_20400 [Sphingobacterium athyrii]